MDTQLVRMCAELMQESVTKREEEEKNRLAQDNELITQLKEALTQVPQGGEGFVYRGFHSIELIKRPVKGKMVLRERLHLPSAVGALVVDMENRMGLVRQYRPAVDADLWEIPAGILDKELSPQQTLLEELQEECEIPPREVIHMENNPIARYFMVAGSSDAEMQIFHIRVETQTNKKVADVDVEEVAWYTVEQVAQMIATHQIRDAKTIIAFQAWRDSMATLTGLEHALLSLWRSNHVDYLYKYKNHIHEYTETGENTMLYFDTTGGKAFKGLTDLASRPAGTRRIEVVVHINELLGDRE